MLCWCCIAIIFAQGHLRPLGLLLLRFQFIFYPSSAFLLWDEEAEGRRKVLRSWITRTFQACHLNVSTGPNARAAISSAALSKASLASFNSSFSAGMGNWAGPLTANEGSGRSCFWM